MDRRVNRRVRTEDRRALLPRRRDFFKRLVTYMRATGEDFLAAVESYLTNRRLRRFPRRKR